jgi:4-amino-4-deoxy-L-arabinose transferase-like glycosyltransferase
MTAPADVETRESEPPLVLSPAVAERSMMPRTRVLLWLVCGLILLAWLGMPPVRRTQEARVLETARQMLGTGLRGWMLPNLNGVPRLQKPPLTYWMAAGAFKIGGVNEFAGRLPFILLAWGTVGLTYVAGTRLLRSESAALVAAAGLFGELLFFRNSRLAETDGPATFFVTLGVYAFWRAATERRLRWFHVGAVGVAGAVMSKGPPGAYPILFLLLLPLVLRDRGVRVLLDFLRSGALLTIILLAIPWYAYVYFSGNWAIVGRELDVVIAGEEHARPAYNYIPAILLALLPWSAAVVVAFAAAVGWAWRGNVVLRGLLAWTGAVTVPLLLIGQKQNHYLLPALPPLALLFGWAVTAREAEADERGAALSGLMRVILICTVGVAPLAAVAIPVIGRIARGGKVWSIDFVLAAAVLMAFAAVLWLARRRGMVAAVAGGALSGAALLSTAEALWLPNVDPDDARVAAAYVRRDVAPAPLCFYKANISLPLCFDLKQAIPIYRTDEELARARVERPGLVVVSVAKPERAPPPPPGMAPFGRRIHVGEVGYTFYRSTAATPVASQPIETDERQ